MDLEAPGPAPDAGHLLEDAALRLFAETRKVPDPVGPGGLLQPVEGRHSELFVDLADPFGAQAGHVHELAQLFGSLLADFVEERKGAGPDHGLDLLRQVLPDARQPGQVLPFPDQVRRASGEVRDGAGRAPVRPDPERVFTPDVKEVGDLVEDLGDVRVMDRHRASIASAFARSGGSSRACPSPGRTLPSRPCPRRPGPARRAGGPPPA